MICFGTALQIRSFGAGVRTAFVFSVNAAGVIGLFTNAFLPTALQVILNVALPINLASLIAVLLVPDVRHGWLFCMRGV